MSQICSSNSPLDLLLKLGSGVRPDGVIATSCGQGQPCTEGSSFEDLLKLARDGNVEPGAPLTLAQSVSADLGNEALAALSIATDAAEAQGATRLAAQIGGNVYTIDVNRREIQSVTPAQSNAVFTGVDAFVALDAGASGGKSDSSGGAPLALPGSLAQNETLLRLFEQRAG